MKIVSFKLDDELFAVEITKVKEINRNVEYTIVPLADSKIVGLFNMRGQVVTLFNLAIMLGHSSRDIPERVTCIILKDSGGSPNQKGFIIQQTGDVYDIPDDACLPPPPNTDPAESGYLQAVARADGHLVRILNTEALFNEF